MLTPEQLQTINGIDLALWATGFLMGYGFRKLVTWVNAQERALRQDLRFYRRKGQPPPKFEGQPFTRPMYRWKP